MMTLNHDDDDLELCIVIMTLNLDDDLESGAIIMSLN